MSQDKQIEDAALGTSVNMQHIYIIKLLTTVVQVLILVNYFSPICYCVILMTVSLCLRNGTPMVPTLNLIISEVFNFFFFL